MTIRTFWTIFIKILGIWLVLDSLTVVPQFLTALPFYGNNYDENIWSLLAMVAMLLVTITMYILILWLFVFKTSWLIDKLHLDRGFVEERIEFKIERSTVLSIATIVLGGLMFIDSLPQLCRQVFVFFQQKTLFGESPNTGFIIFHSVKTVIGYLLMTNSQYVVNFIDRQNTKPDGPLPKN